MSKDKKRYMKLERKWRSYPLMKRIKFRLIFIFGTSKHRLKKDVYAFLVMDKKFREEKRSRIGLALRSFIRKFAIPFVGRLSGEDGIGKDFDKHDSMTDKVVKSGKKIVDTISDLQSSNESIEQNAKEIRKEIKKSKSIEELLGIINLMDTKADQMIEDGSAFSKKTLMHELKLSLDEDYHKKEKELKKEQRVKDRHARINEIISSYTIPYTTDDIIAEHDDYIEPSPFDDIQEPTLVFDVNDNDKIFRVSEDDEEVFSIDRESEDDCIEQRIFNMVDTAKAIKKDIEQKIEEYEAVQEEKDKPKFEYDENGLVIIHRIHPKRLINDI